MTTLLEFSCGHQRFGLKLADVERVIPVTALAPLPGAPRIVMGVINLHGEIVPVIDFQQRVGLGPTQLTPAQRFIIARTSQRRLCLVVDETAGLRPAGEPDLQLADLPKAKLIQGLLALPDGLAMVCDLDAFLSLEERSALDSALTQGDA